MRIKGFVNNKDLWEAFCEEVDVYIAAEHKRLEQYEEMRDLYRAQGAIKALQRMKKLRDDVNGRKD